MHPQNAQNCVEKLTSKLETFNSAAGVSPGLIKEAKSAVDRLAQCDLPGWGESTSFIQAKLEELASCHDHEESRRITTDIFQDLKVLQHNANLLAQLTKEAVKSQGTYHCEINLGIFLAFPPDDFDPEYKSIARELAVRA